MKDSAQLNILSDFFLDGAKIIFGSLVVGAFLPGTTVKEFSWLVFFSGVTLTVAFLLIAYVISHKNFI